MALTNVRLRSRECEGPGPALIKLVRHAKLVIGRVLARMSRRSLFAATRTWKARATEYRRQRGLAQKVSLESEIHFLPAIGGG